MKLIFATLAGSHLYGTNTSQSDIDIRGVCLSPIESLLGLQKFEQQTYNTNTWAINEFNIDSDDVTIYSLQKFTRLAINANPNIIELLFTNKPLRTTSEWESILKIRHAFLSTKIISTFSGYAYSQLMRIKGHRKWIESPPIKPNPEHYSMVYNNDGGQKWLDSNQYNKYKGLLKNFQNYESWVKNRNPKRRVLEEKYGYDTKHAAHIYRLILEAEELLTSGNLILPLSKDKKETIVEVLNGGLTYDEIITLGNASSDMLKSLESKSILPKKPNYGIIQDTIINIYINHIKELK